MRPGWTAMRDQRGVALALALVVLLVITALALTYLTLGSVEPRISQNLTDGARARYVAEAGVEWGFNALAGSSSWSAYLASLPVVDGKRTMITASPLPGLTTASGTFTVTVRNDNQAGDPTLTGVAQDPGDDVTDTNARLIMTAVGRVGTAVRTITAVVARAQLPPFPGALVFPGNEAEVAFSGNSFEITGNDTRLDGTPGPGAPVFGISVSSALPLANPGANEGVVEAALSSSQKDNVTGRRQNPALPGEGDNTVAPNPDLTPQAIADFIAQAKAAADLTFNSTPANPQSFTNIGNTCAADWNSTNCWGTRDRPKVVYVKGSPDPTSMFTALAVSGNTTGVGILIVEDGDFRISGNFRWEGPIIVTGNWVGVGYLGGGYQEVLGAVISNETATDPGYREGVVTGNAKLRYSTEALALAQNLRKLVRIAVWQEL